MSENLRLLVEIIVAVGVGVIGFIVNSFQARIRTLERKADEDGKEIAALKAVQERDREDIDRRLTAIENALTEIRNNLMKLVSRS